MADKYREKDPGIIMAEQFDPRVPTNIPINTMPLTSGSTVYILYREPHCQIHPGDWYITSAWGQHQVMSDADFQERFEEVA